MSILLVAEFLCFLINLGIIFLDRKNSAAFKWKWFGNSVWMMVVLQILLFLIAIWWGSSIPMNAENYDPLLYLFGGVYVLSIVLSLILSRKFTIAYNNF